MVIKSINIFYRLNYFIFRIKNFNLKLIFKYKNSDNNNVNKLQEG